jgi:A118 family predicted phage portal protein
MFQKILIWIREVLNKMINTSSVKSALHVDVAITPLMVDALQLWSLMYVNQAPWLNDDIKSLQLPAAIAAEISRAVTIEMDFEISGSPRADYLYEQMEIATKNIRQMVEFGIAKGGLMIKPYVKGEYLCVDFVQADQFYPITFDASGKITSCVFSDVVQRGRDYYTRLEYHAMNNLGCTIINTAFKSTAPNILGNPVPLSSVDAWADLEPEATITGIDKPLFAYFKFPLANNIDPTSPLGVSAYARAVDLIEQADKQWSNFLWEFKSGERALYVDTLAFGKDASGKPILPNKRLYRTLSGGVQLGQDDMFHEWSPTLREVNILNGLDAILKKIEFTCGLAQGTISDPNTVALTATEIKMSKQRTYATITDTQSALEDALEQLLYAMDVWATLGNLAPMGLYDAVFYFDDSIVADHDTTFAQSTQAVGLGVMSKVEFRMVNYGETEEIAKKYIDMIAAEQVPTDFFPVSE